MKVKRIVTNIACVSSKKVQSAKKFYQDTLGLEVLMNMDWIVTYGLKSKMNVQISVISEGGSNAPLPDISIEVDDVDEAFRRMKEGRFKILYPLTDESWGVRRFFVLDPFGKIVNILAHT